VTQSRRLSLVEALASTAIGYVVAVATQFTVFPLFGLRVGIIENLGIGLIFTVVSVARSYLVRRFFEGLNGTRTRGRAASQSRRISS
jgi:hypothetical protein